MQVLITGVTGMVGSHLADYIIDAHSKVTVHGLTRWRSPIDNTRHLDGRIRLHHADLTDLASLMRSLIRRMRNV